MNDRKSGGYLATQRGPDRQPVDLRRFASGMIGAWEDKRSTPS
jgi:hypothetical protein